MLIIFLLLLCTRFDNWNWTNIGETFSDFDFNYASVDIHSKQTNDISDGNPVSWSNKSNYRPLRNTKNNNKYNFTYQGFGIPLKYEQKYTIPAESPSDLMDYIASPSCCPSMFSTDKGCVCKDY